MINVNLHYDVPGWAYHARCLALAKYAPQGFRVTVGSGRGLRGGPGRCDLALQLCCTHVRELRKSYRESGVRPAIAAGMNVGWSEQNAARLQEAIDAADHVIINSRDCWERAGKPEKTTWISNGVERGFFRISTPPAKRRPKLLWTGSDFHRGLKGYDQFVVPICRRLARERPGKVETDPRLVNSHGGPTKWPPERMREWYDSGTVLLCASSSEGTPNPALEAASAGCVVCSTRVGNMPELIQDGVNGRLVDRTLDALYEGVLDCLDRYEEMQAAMEPIIAGWDWRIRAQQYFDLFRRITGQPTEAQS